MDELPDIIAEGLDVLFCGINPGMRAANVGHHFAGNNRFWRTLRGAGFTPMLIAAADDRSILDYRCGLTTLVSRPTRRADELSRHEFLAAATAFEAKITRYAPRFLAFLGKIAYATLSGRRDVAWGRQPETLGGAVVWVLPNPSGLNRAFRLDDLIRAYAELHLAAN